MFYVTKSRKLSLNWKCTVKKNKNSFANILRTDGEESSAKLRLLTVKQF